MIYFHNTEVVRLTKGNYVVVSSLVSTIEDTKLKVKTTATTFKNMGVGMGKQVPLKFESKLFYIKLVDQNFSTGTLGPLWGPRSGSPGDTSSILCRIALQ